ncbi:MAG TPA: hypothetical protein VF162_07445 [Streptosporangiaceae bacterium]
MPRPRGQQQRGQQQRGEQRASQQRAAGEPAATRAQKGGLSLPSMLRPHLPGGTAGTVLWWGGLATVAALGIVDWPVAALVGAGTWVAEQHARQSQRAHAR